MPAKTNDFKAALLRGEQLIGLWMGLGSSSAAELCAHAGFDWVLIDGEHGPNDVLTILDQLRAMQGAASAPVVRAPSDDRVLLKRLLDIGARSLLIPMIESGDQAAEAVRSVRYPPQGVRGVGASLARASNFGAIPDYLATANDQICLLLQVESRAGIEALDDILAVEGVDGVFVGPADLAADMGFTGRPGAPEVQAVVVETLKRIQAAGKASGILTSDRALAKGYADLGVGFLAVGSDVGVLGAGLRALKAEFS